MVEDIEHADGERIQNLSFILGIGNGKLEEIISYNQLVDHLEAAANEDYEICTRIEPSLATRGPTMSLRIARLGRRPMNLSESWQQITLSHVPHMQRKMIFYTLMAAKGSEILQKI